MMQQQQKRSIASLEHNGFVDSVHKRPKAHISLSCKEKKEKFSEGIAALQGLISPYGKSDAASVILEAMEYIKFLHEQVKVLSSPYIYAPPSSHLQGIKAGGGLRSKGLCLVPISFIEGVAGSNGADIWAPIKTSPTTSKRSVPDEALTPRRRRLF